MKIALLGMLLLVTAACGSSPSDHDVTVHGTVHVNSLSLVQQGSTANGRATDDCAVSNLDGKDIVFTDSSGKKIGLTEITPNGKGDAAQDPDAYGGEPGTCNLPFEVTIKMDSGLYTATIQGTDYDKTFTAGEAGALTIEVS